MSEPITNVEDAVREHGALPVPAGPVPSERDRLRAAFVAALDVAHKTHPCPVTGRPFWSGCVHYGEAGRVIGVGSCHSERRADAVLAVRDAELERLSARVAELEAERRSTNEALDDAVRALRADGIARRIVPVQALREDEPAKAPDFFQPGRLYESKPSDRVRFRFRCESVTAYPVSGAKRAIGQHGRLRTADGEWMWSPDERTESDWDKGHGGWVDITETGGAL